MTSTGPHCPLGLPQIETMLASALPDNWALAFVDPSGRPYPGGGPKGSRGDQPGQPSRVVVRANVLVDGEPVGQLLAEGPQPEQTSLRRHVELTAARLADAWVSAREIDSLAREVVHAYQELHLVYDLGDAVSLESGLAAAADAIVQRAVDGLEAAWGELRFIGGEQAIVATAGEEPTAALQAATAPDRRLRTELRAAGATIGTITVGRRRSDPVFVSDDQKLLNAIGALAANAIQNAQLYNEQEQIQRLAAELADLNHTLEERVDEQVEQLDRLGELRRFLSPQLTELVVTSGNESLLESHRREIAVVFGDLRGFTKFAEAGEPEDVMDVLRQYHEALGVHVNNYNGTVGFFAGDGLMVFFNDPVPCDDPAERAVAMAIGMRDDMQELTQSWRKRGADLGFGTGIALGYATLGRVGFEGRYDYTAIGAVVNQAARLCAEAENGQILVTPRVLTAVKELVESKHVGDLELKGFQQPIEAHNVVRLKEENSLSRLPDREPASAREIPGVDVPEIAQLQG